MPSLTVPTMIAPDEYPPDEYSPRDGNARNAMIAIEVREHALLRDLYLALYAQAESAAAGSAVPPEALRALHTLNSFYAGDAAPRQGRAASRVFSSSGARAYAGRQRGRHGR